MGAALVLVCLSLCVVIQSSCYDQIKGASSQKKPIHPAFDVAQAMKMFYGNYDEATRKSTMPNSHNNGLNAFDFGAEQIAASPLFHTFTQEAAVQSFVLVTYGIPLDKMYDCHACAPVIGMAVFSNIGEQWVMTASNRAVTQAGAWGKPETHIHLARIGPAHYGVVINDSGSGNGEATTVLLLLIPWKNTVNVGLERIIADDDAGMCGELSTLPCYSNSRRITFLLEGKDEFYKIKLSLVGTDYVNDSNSKSGTAPVLPKRRVRGVEILALKEGKYVQLSRSGSLTTLDQAVADREHLK
jgi:hypothetical protein